MTSPTHGIASKNPAAKNNAAAQELLALISAGLDRGLAVRIHHLVQELALRGIPGDFILAGPADAPAAPILERLAATSAGPDAGPDRKLIRGLRPRVQAALIYLAARPEQVASTIEPAAAALVDGGILLIEGYDDPAVRKVVEAHVQRAGIVCEAIWGTSLGIVRKAHPADVGHARLIEQDGRKRLIVHVPQVHAEAGGPNLVSDVQIIAATDEERATEREAESTRTAAGAVRLMQAQQRLMEAQSRMLAPPPAAPPRRDPLAEAMKQIANDRPAPVATPRIPAAMPAAAVPIQSIGAPQPIRFTTPVITAEVIDAAAAGRAEMAPVFAPRAEPVATPAPIAMPQRSDRPAPAPIPVGPIHAPAPIASGPVGAANDRMQRAMASLSAGMNAPVAAIAPAPIAAAPVQKAGCGKTCSKANAIPAIAPAASAVGPAPIVKAAKAARSPDLSITPSPTGVQFSGLDPNQLPDAAWDALRRRLVRHIQATDGEHAYIIRCETPAEQWRALGLERKEAGTVRWIRSVVQPGDTFYDIGANIGLYSLMAARRVGPTGMVYAFEPHVANVDGLLHNLALNQLGDRVQVLGAALNDKEGYFEFNYRSEEAGSSMSQLHATVDAGEQSFRPVFRELKFATTIDALLARGAIRPATHVKIDVDGNELLILRGMRELLASSAAPRTIQVEINARYKAELFAFMAQMGYPHVERHDTENGAAAIARGARPESVGYNCIFRRQG